MCLKRRKLLNLMVILILVLMVISIAGCGSNGGNGGNGDPDDNPPVNNISDYFGSWKSTEISPEVRFTINNDLLGKDDFTFEDSKTTFHYYGGSITCNDVLGAPVAISEKHPVDSGDSCIVIFEESQTPGFYGLMIYAGDGEDYLAFTLIYNQGKLWGSGEIFLNGEAIYETDPDDDEDIVQFIRI